MFGILKKIQRKNGIEINEETDEDEPMIKKIYEKICDILSLNHISWAALGIFILSMLPIVYLSFFNRASGDDYGYGTYTRAVWVASGSIWEVIKAAAGTVRQYYYGWQGTWFSIFVFALQPEVFSEKAYVIVAFMMLFFWIGSTCVLAREILISHFGMDKNSCRLIILILLFLNIQFIPNPKSSIFWFNGCAHYMLPFTMCQILAYWLLKFRKNYQWKYYAGICIFMALLGGANYQAALFALIITVYLGMADFMQKRNPRIFFLGIPLMMELVGLIISMKAPGNKVRGGEDFGLSVQKAAETVAMSFAEGIRTIGIYLQTKPIVFVGLLVLFVVTLEAMKARQKQSSTPHPMIISLALFCLYSAMQAPALYAGVEVSNGVHNTNYQVFLFMASHCLFLAAENLSGKLTDFSGENIHRWLVMPVIFFSFLLIIFFRSSIKESTLWKSMDYIVTGQAADYKMQMDLQTQLLMDESTMVVILPFINDQQGPLMHMPATENPEAWTNTVIRQFYGKNSVVAMPREEWEALNR